MITLINRRTLNQEILLAASLIIFIVSIVRANFLNSNDVKQDPPAEEEKQHWRLEPVGRTWIEFYAPHDTNTFMYTGSESALRLFGPSRFEVTLFVHMSTYAGYRMSANGSGPRTPVDLLHERWQEGLAVSYKLNIPLHFYLLRDCNHQLDNLPGGPFLWTDAVLGAGTLPPFRTFFLREDHPHRQFYYLWFLGGGPTMRSQKGSIWDSKNVITGEGWARGFAERQIKPWLSANGYVEANMQGSTVAPKIRHRIMTEVGVTFHTGNGGWRFYYGRRWRDTTHLWPSDQRNYLGMGYVF